MSTHPALLRRAAACQLVGLVLLLALHRLAALSGWPLFAAAGVGAGLAAVLLGLPRWWWPISTLFLPTLAAALALNLPASVYAGALLACLLLFGTVMRSRVPLWLSGRRARAALIAELPAGRDLRAIDLGGGLGGMLLALWRSGRCSDCAGVEWAPLPWLFGWIRLRLAGFRGRWRFGSLWQEPLHDYDLVYAFLSPAAMPALWEKARTEMRPGSWLVSYRFPIPGVPAQRTIRVGERADDVLLIWILPASAAP